ncbi:F0F1 ATP synthase subunit epsilon [Beijerinckia indica]|uniref:ATP synthase epsilon chain n=1 Tax=Beijerinckia indica subsp. indica (strain ATCC 9039 / DSM 1715 / NCIMB 8712) TaxID=395963 RepID=B2ICI4_BEII9|nr:F0F1 ATP synthase subunit epsilon [Beijerinckia indica]ACB93873.1 ATP synthase F1, epsilon subunit [Beijerinckia indica subsp. indica ATCC 9039]
MAAFHFELVSPERLVFSGEADSVVVPGVEGEFTVLAGHAPFMTTLRPGLITVNDATSKEKLEFYTLGGFVDVGEGGLTILADVALPIAEADQARFTADLAQAETDIHDAPDADFRLVAIERRDQLAYLKTLLRP